MKREMAAPERDHISFEALGEAIAAYEEAFYAHNAACFVNQAYDEEGFATISGQDLEDWKKEFPRVADEEVARLEDAATAAEEQLIDTLGLESPDIIPALCETYGNEKNRQRLEGSFRKLVEKGKVKDRPREGDLGRHAIAIASQGRDPQDMIAGTIAMAELTGKTYVMYGGVRPGTTYYYAYANVGPDQAVDDVIREFAERGLALTSTLLR